MKIVYFGSDVFLSSFEYLTAHHQILALYTYHNDEDYFTEYMIVRRAAELDIPVHYENITPERIRQYFEEDGCQLFFMAEYDRIIQISMGADNTWFRGINIHSSLLPEGRSYYPIEAAMERALDRTGVTLHKVTEKVDSGAILAQREIEISPDMDSIDIYIQCAACAREMVENIMENLDEAWENALPQRERRVYWNRPEESLLTLTHSQTLAKARNIFRLYNSMTQVRLKGRWYYVTALMTGVSLLPQEEIPFAEGRWLYAVEGGHLRIHVYPVSEKEEKQ